MRPSSDEDLQIVHTRADHVILGSPRLFISIHHGPATLASVAAESNYARTRMSREPASVGCLVVLGGDTTPPDGEVRAVMPRLFSDIAPGSAGLAMVIEGGGFRVAALRAAFAGLRMIGKITYPTAVFNSAAEALAWLCPRVGLDTGAMTRRLAARRAEVNMTEPAK
ncbi:MAG: hypothetical protein U0359_29105 [Byssovorax sp.]